MVELDEMHTYIGNKKNTVGSGLLLIDLEKDSSVLLLVIRSNQTAKEFWETIQHHKMEKIASDHWKSCESIVSEENYLQTKAETFTVEGYNILFRHF